jgi:hypothetical protein
MPKGMPQSSQPEVKGGIRLETAIQSYGRELSQRSAETTRILSPSLVRWREISGLFTSWTAGTWKSFFIFSKASAGELLAPGGHQEDKKEILEYPDPGPIFRFSQNNNFRPYSENVNDKIRVLSK